jgi:alpha-tubulin suppressor-like RCC1 family protein
MSTHVFPGQKSLKHILRISTLIGALVLGTLLPITASHSADKFVDIGTGFLHTCGLTSAGDVYCWGNNEVGQLGKGNLGDPESLPIKVPGLSGITSISVGPAHTCAVTKAKTVLCWGQNGNGKLGTGDIADKTSPTLVKDLTGVKQVSASRLATCALKDDGTVYCFGANDFGQLGIGSTTAATVPTKVAGITDAIQISLGYTNGCAVTKSQALYCWGDNSNFQLGAEGPSTTSPVLVAEVGKIAKISVGSGHLCAKTATGTALCWGYGERGQIGSGTKDLNVKPAAPTGLGKILDISAGRFHTCALNADRSVSCWGAADTGQIGNGTIAESTVPVKVLNISNVQVLGTISAYAAHTCTIAVTGNYSCWGLGNAGQLGNGTSVNSNAPTNPAPGTQKDTSAPTSDTALTTVIKCKKGSSTKEVKGVSPKCPSGYVQVVEKKPTPVFYLDMKVGCYSLNFPVTDYVYMYGTNKTLFPASCSSRHHIQVIFSGKMKTAAANGLPTQAEVGDFCGKKYIAAMGSPAPKQVIANGIYVYWMFPDAGFEVRKYPNKVICNLITADKSYSYITVQSKSIARSAL